MEENILEIRNIGKTFSYVNVLRDVNLTLKAGEILALMGENGAGKSTLIKVLNGYHKPDPGGEIILHGEHVTFKSPKDALDKHIHTIYQELTLCKDMTVAENIVIDKIQDMKGIFTDKKRFKEIAKEALASLGTDINPDAYVRDLSIAQQQMVEIAKAISSNAEILILDEPTASISERDSQNLLKIVRDMRDKGKTIIYITHRMHEVRQIADRICVLCDGKQVGVVKPEETSDDDLVSMMIGYRLENAYPKSHVELGNVVLKVKDLQTDEFSKVSFEVRAGEICGIGGLVGAKRTEILETLFGLRKMTGGSIELFGKPYKPIGPHDAIAKGMAFATEDRKKSGLILCMPIYENINLVNADNICSRKGILNINKFWEIAKKYREKLNIKLANMREPVSTLSGGNMQKVVLAKWMEMKPKIVLFDEPTRGIDIGAKAEIYKIMGEMARDGTAVIMVSSEMPELIAVADKIVVMAEGRMTGIIDREEATQEKILKLASMHFDKKEIKE